MSTKDLGCFFCDGKSLDIHESCPKCSKPIDIESELLSLKIHEYEMVNLIGRGFYGWTIKVVDSYQTFAMKIIPSHRLKKTLENKEARALAECSPHRNIARFIREIKENVNLLGQNISIVCIVFEYIDRAQSLNKFISESAVELNKSDVVGILKGIASGLSRMHSKGLWHDDLHDDNILIRKVASDENLPERYESKLIDFGSVKELVLGEPETIDGNDYLYLSKHILSLIAKFEMINRQSLTPADRSFARRLRQLASRLSDANISRRNFTPSDVIIELDNSLQDSLTGYDFQTFNEMKKRSNISFGEPLDKTNAINLAPQDIALLFRDSLEWQKKIIRSEPVLIVGPRGCGKTMLLRYLSISSQARPKIGEKEPEEVATRLNGNEYIAFMLNVGELRTPFLRSSYKKLEIEDRELAEDFCREFINAHFLFEVLRTIVWLKTENLAEISDDDLKPLTRDMLALLKINDKSITTVNDIIGFIDRRIVELSNLYNPSSYKPSNICGDNSLILFTRAIKSIPWIASKSIWFLLDDFSYTILPQLTILSYSPVLFRLSSEVEIKFSSEGDGPVFEDTLDRKYKESREYTKVNLGEVYFQNDEKTCLIFFEQILTARFEATQKGSLLELKNILGEHEFDSNFGKYICNYKPPGKSKFYGFSLICRLCSGDVSYIIELLNNITSGRWGKKVKKISSKEQDEIVKRFAQRQLADLRTTAKFGPQLHKFAEKLGNLIKQYLLDSKNKDQADERLRIEIEGEGELNTEAKELHDELLRHSILIPGGAGKSRAGLPTRKYYFRRLFAPCFPFSPTRSGSIPLTVHEYQSWLLNPNMIWNKHPEETPLIPGE